MTMIHKTDEIIRDLLENAIPYLNELEIDPAENEYTIIQPLDDGNGILLEVKEIEGQRVLNVLINDTMVLLPSIEGTLDVFDEEESQ